MSNLLLINEKEGRVLKKGEEVTTFRGEKAVLKDWREPGVIGGGMNGKVYCDTKTKDGKPFSNEWYPSVIGAEFVDAKEIYESIISALDENLGGTFDSHIMEQYCPEIQPENYSNSADFLLAHAEKGLQLVIEGKVSLNELLGSGLKEEK